MNKKRNSIISRLSKISFSHFLIALLIIASFLIGSLWTRVQYLEKANAINILESDNQGVPQQAEPTEDQSPKKVSIDDDAVLGNKSIS